MLRRGIVAVGELNGLLKALSTVRKQTDKASAGLKSEGFIPDFCKGNNVFLVIVGAELLALILTLAPGFKDGEFWTRLALISLFIQWVALGSVGTFCAMKGRLESLTARQSAVLVYSIILIITLLVSLISIWLLDFLYLQPMDWAFATQMIFRSLVISAIVIAVMLRYFYVQHQWMSNTEAEVHSRIQALQARIRPHFLFNSMNTIASLTRSNPVQAEKAVEDLATLFRVSLADRNFLTLDEELEVTRGYLDIETHRLGSRLQLDWQIDDKIDFKTKLPALILQPLVENALYHGIEPLTEGGVVKVSLSNHPDGIEVAVSNPFKMDMKQSTHKGNRMAQENIRQRLQLAFGDEGGLNIKTDDNRYVVSFKIPR